MNFEEALTEELNKINDLKGKVYPLDAPKGTKAPYLIHVLNETYDKDLNGTQNDKEVSCEISIFNTRYNNMKALSKTLFNKLKSFEGRVIGTNGPYIQEITFEGMPELYEEQVNLYRKIINFKVYFKEE